MAEKCGAKTRSGTDCGRPAGWGTDHSGIGRCKNHGGSTPNHKRAAQKEIARRECATLGLAVEIDPGEALIQELWETAGNVAFYRELVQQLPMHPEPDAYVDGEGGGHWKRGDAGVYGRSYHVSGIPTGEAKPHVLVALYNEERKHLAAVAAAALKAGVDQRRVELEQQRGALIADVFRRVFADPELGLEPEKRRQAMTTAARHLRLVAGG